MTKDEADGIRIHILTRFWDMISDLDNEEPDIDPVLAVSVILTDIGRTMAIGTAIDTPKPKLELVKND